MAEATAPASSANLGPGFDTLALAIDIPCRVVAEQADAWRVSHHGLFAPVEGDDDAVLAAAQAAVGVGNPLMLDVHNEIPLGRGLGSSAAAFASGAAAALRAVGKPADPDTVFSIAADLEGHSDNVAAAVYGGLVAAVGSSAHRLEMDPGLRVVVAVPSRRLPTKWARQALPEIIEHDAAARSVARAIALVEAFRTADPQLFAAASGDELHEGPRGPLFPEAEDLMLAALSAGAFHACWSGAGPSILAIVPEAAVDPVVSALSIAMGGEGSVLAPGIDHHGLV